MFRHVVLANDQISFAKGANLSQLLKLCHMVGYTLGFVDGST